MAARDAAGCAMTTVVRGLCGDAKQLEIDVDHARDDWRQAVRSQRVLIKFFRDLWDIEWKISSRIDVQPVDDAHEMQMAKTGFANALQRHVPLLVALRNQLPMEIVHRAIQSLLRPVGSMFRPVVWSEMREIAKTILKTVIETKNATAHLQGTDLIRYRRLRAGLLEVYRLELCLRCTCTRLQRLRCASR